MLRDEYKNFQKRNTEIIGMSADSVKAQKNFCSKQEFPFSLLSDPEKETIRSYNAFGLKKFMGREFMGTIRSTFLVDKKGKILKKWKDIKVKDHAKEVLETLQKITGK